MEVNPRAMRKFTDKGIDIDARYNGAPRFRETNLFGPNCTTYTIDRLAGGGINLPIWMRTPSLVNKWASWVCRFQ